MSVKLSKIAQALGMIVTWTAVILQLYLIMLNRSVSMMETLIRFLEFFTILTNIAVAICFTYLLFVREPRLHFFTGRITWLQSPCTFVLSVLFIILFSEPCGLRPDYSAL